MKRATALLLAVSALSLPISPTLRATPAAAAAAPSARATLGFDHGWRFVRGDAPDAQAPGFDDSGWTRVDVPHDWSIAGPFDKSNPTGAAGAFLPAGIGWYRKTFTLPPGSEGRRVSVQFDGVMANSDVWINGVHLGHRPNGTISFAYDLTSSLRPAGQANVIAVRVDDSQQPASRWAPGAGIIRHVRLVIKDPVHLAHWGTVVTTPRVSEAGATVHVATTAVNQSGAERTVRLEELLFDPAGRLAARAVSPAQAVAPGKSAELGVDLAVAHPELWDVDSPRLYRAVTLLESADAAGTVLDNVTTPVGLRDARFEAATGFWLNGRNLKIKGVCLHDDGSAFGAAVPLSVWARRLAALRALGVNAIRTAHNPPAPEFLDLCDRMGFLVMDESFDCWTVGKNPYDYHLHFEKWALTDLRDMVMRDRNHPSIILWSAGNEIHDTPHTELAKRILASLVRVYHEVDPTRPVTQALFRPNVSHDYDDGLADMLDVVGTNYRFNELLAAHAAKPSRKIIGTENNHELSSWLAVRDNPAYSGEFIWSGIDYLGEAHAWPGIANSSGLLDRTGYPHPDGMIFASWWANHPMVYVARRVARAAPPPTDPGYGKAPAIPAWRRQVLFSDWTPSNPAPHDEQVEVYSNCDQVELFLNGRSLGAQARPADLTPRAWSVPYSPGTLRAVGRDGGRVVAESDLTTAGAPARIHLSVDCSRLAPGWNHVATVTAVVTDANGVPVPAASNEITFSASGPGSVVAVDSADNTSHEPFQASERRAFQGRCVAMVRASATDGPITVHATSPGLGSADIVLTAVP